MLNKFSYPSANKAASALLASVMIALGSLEIFNMFSNISIEWPWVLGALLYSVTINDVFCHRICAHSMFRIDEKSLTFKIFVLLNTIDNGFSSSRIFLQYHSLHHRHTNSKLDTGSAHYWLSAVSSPFRDFITLPKIPDTTQKSIQIKGERHANVINDPWVIFCEKNQAIISVTVFAILAVFAPIILFKIIFPGRVFLSIVLISHVLCHSNKTPFNYRLKPSKSNSFNNLILHYLVLGLAGSFTLQSSHHLYPHSLNLGKRWYEIDSTYPIAMLLKLLLEKRT
jgi:stearoyl-CoA desaturase (Delta-9 desaturase)